MKIYGIAIALAAATLFVSCSRDEDATQGGGCRELAVNVQMQNSDWQTRSGAEGTSGGGSAADVPTPVALDEQLEVVTECEPIGYTPDAPLTRGTPIGSATGLQTLGFAVYTNSVFTKNCTATYAGGSWNIANNIALDLDKNKYSYYAYAPVAVAADNGIVLAASDKALTLTYTAPDDITKQPDLCRATPIKDAPTGTVTFAMQHALTAVGIKVRAANVTIKSITLKQVNTAGTLNLTAGTWGSVTTPKDLTFTLSNTTPPATGDGVADIIASDGYLMLPPQALGGDNKTLVIVYRYGDETTDRTGTHKLSDITGGAWLAGQKVNYVIQLKSNFSLTLTPASATVPLTAGTNYNFGYTTGSSASIDPTPTCDVDWITNLKADHAAGKISFNYAQNRNGVARKAAITVTSGFTTKTFDFTQAFDIGITISTPAPPGGFVYKNGGSYTTTVTTPVGIAWKVASTSNCSVSPTSGSGGETVKITVPSTTVVRDVSVTFSTNVGSGVTEKTATWSGKQLNSVYINGTWWTWTNLTGDASTNTGHRFEANPQDYGMFFKWGTSFVYQRASSGSDGGGWSWDIPTTGAATSPSASNTGGLGYDYAQGLGGGLNPGDPCQKLGANYRTPTRAQWQSLQNAGTKWGSYNGISGRFFGPSASSCNSSTIQPGCIFLPASGYRRYDNGTQYNYLDCEGCYWSSSVNDVDYGWRYYFNNYYGTPNEFNGRGCGYSVRCIYEP